MPLGQRIARRWDVSTSVTKTNAAEEINKGSDRNLQIHGLGLALHCGPRNLEGLCLRAHCTPVEGNVGDRSPPPSAAPSPLLPCTLYLCKVEDKGTERTRRKRRTESDHVSSYPSCESKRKRLDVSKIKSFTDKNVSKQFDGVMCRLVCRVVTIVTGYMTHVFTFSSFTKTEITA